MAKKYRVVAGYGPLSLRQSPDKESPLYEQWFNWRDGQVFEPPKHMNVERSLARGIIEEVKGNG